MSVLKIKDGDGVWTTVPAVASTVDDGSITTDKLADDAVTTVKIDDEAVTRDKLADDIVSVIDDAEIKLPNPPSSDGTYKLTVTVSSGEPTYSWES